MNKIIVSLFVMLLAGCNGNANTPGGGNNGGGPGNMQCDFGEVEPNDSFMETDFIGVLTPVAGIFHICGNANPGNLDWFQFAGIPGSSIILNVGIKSFAGNTPAFGLWAGDSVTGAVRFVKSYVSPFEGGFIVENILLALSPTEDQVFVVVNSFGIPQDYQLDVFATGIAVPLTGNNLSRQTARLENGEW